MIVNKSYISHITLRNSESAKLTSVPTNSTRNVTVPHVWAACMLYYITPEYKYRTKFSVIYTAAAKQQILQQFAYVQHIVSKNKEHLL